MSADERPKACAVALLARDQDDTDTPSGILTFAGDVRESSQGGFWSRDARGIALHLGHALMPPEFRELAGLLEPGETRAVDVILVLHEREETG